MAPQMPSEVAKVFAQQYCHVLQHSPELVPRFYKELSKFGRAGADGEMIIATTLDAISKKIQSSSGFAAQVIKSVDVQDSLDGGVTVLLTGFCADVNGGKRFFSQSLFLAPQASGYFVLNDMLRFSPKADGQLAGLGSTINNGLSLVPELGALQQETEVGDKMIHSEEGVQVNKEATHNHERNEDSVVEEEVASKVVTDEVPKSSQAAMVELVGVSSQQEMPKKTYASVLKLMNGITLKPTPTSTPARPSQMRKERLALPASEPVQTSKVPSSSSDTAESSNMQETEADGRSIYVKNLPMEATPAQMEEEFKRFGPIKPGGIQVRSNKLHVFCYGFVEFEVPNAVQSAIEASPVTVGGRPAYIEKKKSTSSRASGRGRFPASKGGVFRNDRMRGRGGYGGGRGYSKGY